MPIIAFAGQKGGSGKTTLAVNAAAEWSARGRKVLLVDADPQGSARTWAAVAAERGIEAPTVVAMGEGMHRPDQLPTLAQGFDLVLVDCPPRHGRIAASALMVADVAVLPCGPSAFDAWALAETLDLVNEACIVRPRLQVRIAITKKVPNTVIAKTAREVLGSHGVALLATEVGYRIAFQEAPQAGVGITRYQPTGTAANELRALVDELEGLFAPEAANAA